MDGCPPSKKRMWVCNEGEQVEIDLISQHETGTIPNETDLQNAFVGNGLSNKVVKIEYLAIIYFEFFFLKVKNLEINNHDFLMILFQQSFKHLVVSPFEFYIWNK